MAQYMPVPLIFNNYWDVDEKGQPKKILFHEIIMSFEATKCLLQISLPNKEVYPGGTT
jgi:hypothetical protein